MQVKLIIPNLGYNIVFLSGSNFMTRDPVPFKGVHGATGPTCRSTINNFSFYNYFCFLAIRKMYLLIGDSFFQQHLSPFRHYELLLTDKHFIFTRVTADVCKDLLLASLRLFRQFLCCLRTNYLGVYHCLLYFHLCL